MSHKKDLSQLRVLVTRPLPEGEALCELIKSRGGHAVYLPTLEIIPLNSNLGFQYLDRLDILIFNSPQAVYQSSLQKIPSHVKIAAIGKGTARALDKNNLPAHIVPPHEWNTEGLLKLPFFQQIKGKEIGIIKGEGGRKLLTDTLRSRGAKVKELIVYRRSLPTIKTEIYVDLLRNDSIDVIISTSNEGLQNLKILLSNAWDKLRAIALLVISERMRLRAKELGFENVFLAKNADNEIIIEALLNRVPSRDR